MPFVLSLRRTLRVLSSGPVVIALVAAFFGLSILWFRFGPAVGLTAGGGRLLDSWTEYTAEQGYLQIQNYGPSGRTRYIIFLLGDYFWVLLFGLATGALVLMGLRRFGSMHLPWTALLAAPILVVVLDWVENTLLLIATSRFPDRLPGLLSFTPGVTAMKLSLVNLTMLLVFAAVIGILLSLLLGTRRSAQ